MLLFVVRGSRYCPGGDDGRPTRAPRFSAQPPPLWRPVARRLPMNTGPARCVRVQLPRARCRKPPWLRWGAMQHTPSHVQRAVVKRVVSRVPLCRGGSDWKLVLLPLLRLRWLLFVCGGGWVFVFYALVSVCSWGVGSGGVCVLLTWLLRLF